MAGREAVNGKDLLVTLFALGTVLLSWPFLTIVNHARPVLGIPLLVLYLFVVWALLIAALAWVTHGGAGGGGRGAEAMRSGTARGVGPGPAGDPGDPRRGSAAGGRRTPTG